jgi:hypothetical protein
MMERVVERIAQTSKDRMRIVDMGETNEHRTMHLAVITASENLERLNDIKSNVARLSDPRRITPHEAQQLIEQTPLIVWLNYTIHGNETASFEAMMQVIYQLAASNDPTVLNILKNCVVLVNMCANPDGHERFVAWYNSFSTGNPDQMAAEHDEPWAIHGRGNRYRFDLNRDNLVSSQIETRLMQRTYLEWNPQVFVDHHGQPSQYFFPPAAQPINPNLPIEMTTKWLSIFGRANAVQFDKYQWDFYVRDVFDLFYPGYWDSWPSLNGATGMTYETDGGGFKGLKWKRDDETIVTFRSAIAKHFIASMTTLETAANNRQARLNDYYEFKRMTIEEMRKNRMQRIVLLPEKDPALTSELVDILLRAGIEIKTTSETFRSSKVHSYLKDKNTSSYSFPPGSYIIDLAQPQGRIAKALLEPDTEQDDSFIREQIARFKRNEMRGKEAAKEDYGFYDITSWSLPIAFGVKAYWTEDATPLRHTISVPMQSPPMNAAINRAAVAYIIPYESNGAASLVYQLQREGFRLAVATRDLNAAGKVWPRGTVVVRVSRNSTLIHEAIARLAKQTNARIEPINTGFTETGETGVGSETVVSLKRPNILVVADEPVSQTSYGAIWWLFDRYGVNFTPVTINALMDIKLDQYTVIILPDGTPAEYLSAFGKDGVETLRGWCERGGTLICIKGAAVFAALRDVNLTTSRLVGSDDDDQKGSKIDSKEAEETDEEELDVSTSSRTNKRDKKPKSTLTSIEKSTDLTEKLEGAPPVLPPIASPSARPGQVPEAVPGAVMRATIDRTTPLTYGYEEETLPVLVNSGYFFRPSKEGTNAVVFDIKPDSPLHISGFIWPDNTENLLRGTAYIFEEPTGRGHVVLFAEDPNFRAIWRSTTRLFFNSFLFLPTF